MVRLQQDMTDHHTELRLRTQTPDSRLQTYSVLRTPYSGLRTPDSVLRTPYFGLRTPYSVLRTPYSGLRTSVIPKYGRPYDRYVIEGICSIIGQLEKTMVRLQHDILKITVRSSKSVGHILRRFLLVTGTLYRQPWKLRPDAGGACSGKVVTTTCDRHTELPSADGIRTADVSKPRGTAPPTGAGDQRRRRRQPCSGQVDTATGDEDTELSPSSTDRIRAVDVLIHRGTAPATATATATAKRPAGLERCVVFLLWEVVSYSNTMPELE